MAAILVITQVDPLYRTCDLEWTPIMAFCSLCTLQWFHFFEFDFGRVGFLFRIPVTNRNENRIRIKTFYSSRHICQSEKFSLKSLLFFLFSILHSSFTPNFFEIEILYEMDYLCGQLKWLDGSDDILRTTAFLFECWKTKGSVQRSTVQTTRTNPQFRIM